MSNEHNATEEELAHAEKHGIPVVQAIASLRYGMKPASAAEKRDPEPCIPWDGVE